MPDKSSVRSLREFGPVCYTGPSEAPNDWWREFDRALAQALDNGASAKKAEDWALYAAETKYPGGRDAR